MVETNENKTLINIEKIDGNELVIRHGNAEKIEERNPFSISMLTPESLTEYIEKRADYIKSHESVIIVHEGDKTISLVVGQHTQKEENLIAQISLNKDIEDVFGLSSRLGFSREFTNREMIDIVRRNRRFFADRDNSEILKKLMSFSAQRTSQLKQNDDQRGNIDYGVKSQATSNADGLFFMLNMPVLKGGDKVTFSVEIIPNISETQARFYFECLELPDMAKEFSEKRIGGAIDKIREAIPELPVLFQ